MLSLLGLEAVSSPSPPTPPPSKRKQKKILRKRARSEGENAINEPKCRPQKRRKLGQPNPNSNNSNHRTGTIPTRSESPDSSQHSSVAVRAKKKIGRRSKVQKQLPPGISQSDIDRIGAELEMSYQQQRDTNIKRNGFRRKISFDNDDGDNSEIVDLDGYLDQIETADDSDRNSSGFPLKWSRRSRDISDSDITLGSLEADAMEEVNAMLAPYQEGIKGFHRLSQRNRLNSISKSMSNSVSNISSNTGSKRKKSKSKCKLNGKSGCNTKSVPQSNDSKGECDAKAANCGVPMTPKQKPISEKKKLQLQNERFADLLRSKAKSAEKRKRQRSQSGMSEDKTLQIVPMIDDGLQIQVPESDPLDRDLDIFGIAATQIETQSQDDVVDEDLIHDLVRKEDQCDNRVDAEAVDNDGSGATEQPQSPIEIRDKSPNHDKSQNTQSAEETAVQDGACDDLQLSNQFDLALLSESE